MFIGKMKSPVHPIDGGYAICAGRRMYVKAADIASGSIEFTMKRFFAVKFSDEEVAARVADAMEALFPDLTFSVSNDIT